MDIADAFAQYREMQARHSRTNEPILERYVGDPDFGRVPEKPVFVEGIAEASRYMHCLRDGNGNRLEFFRRSPAMQVPGIAGPVDCYLILKTTGFWIFKKSTVVDAIFVSEYSPRTIWLPPQGYSLI